jgi:PhoD-like phosphatase
LTDLHLGPLLRHAGTNEATVWVQTTAPCRVEVRPAGCPAASERTFTVEGHHYALVHVTELPGDAPIPYEVALDGEVVWPPRDSPFPPSVLRTHTVEDPVRIIFGSCRVAAPHEPPYTLRKDEDDRGREVDALRGFAVRMTHADPAEWPHALLLLGDQVYADEVHPHIEDDLDGDGFVESYDDYVRLYTAAWGEPVIRWLLSTVPSAMIFDDHDVHDDWNTSIEWVTEMRQKDWWRRRIVSAFESYLIYQHLGNLSPSERADFELYEHLRTAEDPTPRLREFARQADEEVEGTRWSFCRDIGPARVVMIDSRAGRVLDPGNRSMVDPDEWRWIEEHACGDVQHLLIGTSLPMFMGPAMHWLEAWSEVVADGAWGKPVKKVAEKLRQELDLEHWPAWQASFRRMCDLLIEVGAGRRGEAPSTITIVSGDVHHAYLAEVGFLPGTGVKSAVWQAVCSPFRNPLDANERRVILACWTRFAGLITRALARRAGVADPPVRWRLAHEKPWFNNQVAMLELDGARAKFVLEKAIPANDGKGEPVLERVFERPIEPNADYTRT